MVKKMINPSPITATVVGPDGQEVTLTAKTLNRRELKAWDELNSAEAMAKIPVEDQLPTMVAHIYGGKPEDYFEWDIRVLKGLISHFTSELWNPTE